MSSYFFSLTILKLSSMNSARPQILLRAISTRKLPQHRSTLPRCSLPTLYSSPTVFCVPISSTFLARTMATSSTPTEAMNAMNSAPDSITENATTSSAADASTGETASAFRPDKALPEPTPEDTVQMNMGADGTATAKLDALGPLVVNQDGTMSRIANWPEMSDIERRNTLRILGKRNQLRLKSLRDAKAAEEKV